MRHAAPCFPLFRTPNRGAVGRRQRPFSPRKAANRLSLRCSLDSCSRPSAELHGRGQRLVPENGGAERTRGVAGPAGDTTGRTIVEGAIEVVAGVALAGVEYEQR